MENGNPAAQLTLKVATFRLAKYIAAMMVSLPRVDAIVFTGGGGENESLLRSMTVRHLAVLGYKLDPKQNEKIRGRDGLEGLISAVGTPKILVVKTDEELMIAEDTARLVSS
jgi:acetate kinase